MTESAAAGRLIVLTGPIGAGKTTVAAELIRQLQPPTAYIEGDRFWKFIAKPGPEPRQEAFRVILRAMSETAVTFARGGYEALLDFSMPPDYLERAAALFRGVPVHLAVLRPNLSTCVERAANRKRGAIRDAQALAEFYELFRNVPERHLFTDESASPVVAARRLRTRLEQGEFLRTR